MAGFNCLKMRNKHFDESSSLNRKNQVIYGGAFNTSHGPCPFENLYFSAPF